MDLLTFKNQVEEGMAAHWYRQAQEARKLHAQVLWGDIDVARAHGDMPMAINAMKEMIVLMETRLIELAYQLYQQHQRRLQRERRQPIKLELEICSYCGATSRDNTEYLDLHKALTEYAKL